MNQNVHLVKRKETKNNSNNNENTHSLVAHAFRVAFDGWCVCFFRLPELSNENCENRALYLNVWCVHVRYEGSSTCSRHLTRVFVFIFGWQFLEQRPIAHIAKRFTIEYSWFGCVRHEKRWKALSRKWTKIKRQNVCGFWSCSMCWWKCSPFQLISTCSSFIFIRILHFHSFTLSKRC